ncbi:MAG: hypothetical protein ACK5NT_05335 [Pyrinomonadaceae bacterium]
MEKYYIYLCIGLLLFVVFGQNVRTQQNIESSTVTYCELLKNPEKYDGKEVKVRATYRYGFEWSEIYCLDCRSIGKTWLEASNITKKSEKILKKLPRDDGTVNAIFTGTFESSKGPFGDGSYRFRFMLKEISQAELVTKSGADPEQLPEDIRKKVCCSVSTPEK